MSAITLGRLGLNGLATVLVLLQTDSLVKADHGQANQYQVTNLVSDISGLALLQDSDLVNAWGMSFSSTSPFWISDNGTGLSTLYSVTYDDMGQVQVVKFPPPPNGPLRVAIPGEGNPTGQFFNSEAASGALNGDLFIFVSEDGTISGWRGALGSSAETLVPPSSAVYKGVTLVTGAGGPMLLAANFSQGTVDAFGSTVGPDGALPLLGQFTDPNAPTGYAPFNVQVVGGTVFVTFAKQDETKEDDVAGPGNGLIDTFDPESGSFTLFAAGSDAGGHLHQINSPWGLALAPDTFGKHAGDLLVGNFGSGTIMTFDPSTGKFQGLLLGAQGGPIEIDGLWALAFGNGGRAGRPETLYFTAGPDDERHGLFGGIDPVRHGDDD